MTIRLLHGDCLAVLPTLADASVDSCVTDPPYHLTGMRTGGGTSAVNPANKGQTSSPYSSRAGFMGCVWDGGDIAFRPEVWAEVLRVLKPGGYLLAFGGTRTQHRMVCAIEDAGFEIRDQIGYLFASGFPKSHDVSKGIDKAACAERSPIDGAYARGGMPSGIDRTGARGDALVGVHSMDEDAKWRPVTAPATDAARQWQGWGTALKPAWEAICVARKPLVGTVAANVLKHGTGAYNIDGCRVESCGDRTNARANKGRGLGYGSGSDAERGVWEGSAGRWPANLVHDGSDEVLEAFAAFQTHGAGHAREKLVEGSYKASSYDLSGARQMNRFGDTGTAARFFFSAKASQSERGIGHVGDERNGHPTVKPLDLMQWLCRLVTPPGGTVLDPFAGSGSTLVAADREGFHAIGIEISDEYLATARRRVEGDAGLFAEIA